MLISVSLNLSGTLETNKLELVQKFKNKMVNYL